jgi:hypothetical protein
VHTGGAHEHGKDVFARHDSDSSNTDVKFHT